MSYRVATPGGRAGGLDLGFAHRHHSGRSVQLSFRFLHDGFNGLIALSHFWRVDMSTRVGTFDSVFDCTHLKQTATDGGFNRSSAHLRVTESRVIETGELCARLCPLWIRVRLRTPHLPTARGGRRIDCRDSSRYFVEPYEGPCQRSSAVPFTSVACATYSSHAFNVVGSRVAASTAAGQTRATSGISRNANLLTRTQSS